TFRGGFHHALQIHPFRPGANVPLRRGGGEPTHPGQGDRNREQPEHDRRATSSRPDEGHDLLRRVSSRFDGAPNRAYDGPRTVAGRATKGRSAGQRRTVIRPLSIPPVGRAPAAEIWGDDGGPWARRGGPRRRPHAGLRLRRDRAWPERDLGGDEGRQRRPRGIHNVGRVWRILSERLSG